MLTNKVKNIGVEVIPPKDVCENDKNCPFHGEQNVRGRTFVGKIINAKVATCVTVEWTGKKFIPKYERYKKIRTRVTAHCPSCLGIVEGDTVKIMETRKISKTKNFVVIEKVEVQ